MNVKSYDVEKPTKTRAFYIYFSWWNIFASQIQTPSQSHFNKLYIEIECVGRFYIAELRFYSTSENERFSFPTKKNAFFFTFHFRFWNEIIIYVVAECRQRTFFRFSLYLILPHFLSKRNAARNFPSAVSICTKRCRPKTKLSSEIGTFFLKIVDSKLMMHVNIVYAACVSVLCVKREQIQTEIKCKCLCLCLLLFLLFRLVFFSFEGTKP